MSQANKSKSQCLLAGAILRVHHEEGEAPRDAWVRFLAAESGMVAALRECLGRGARLVLLTEGTDDPAVWDLLREVFPGVLGGPIAERSVVASLGADGAG